MYFGSNVPIVKLKLVKSKIKIDRETFHHHSLIDFLLLTNIFIKFRLNVASTLNLVCFTLLLIDAFNTNLVLF